MICFESYVRPGYTADVLRFDRLAFVFVESDDATLPPELHLQELVVATFGACSMPVMLCDLGQTPGLECAAVLYAARLREPDALAPRVWGE